MQVIPEISNWSVLVKSPVDLQAKSVCLFCLMTDSDLTLPTLCQ